MGEGTPLKNLSVLPLHSSSAHCHSFSDVIKVMFIEPICGLVETDWEVGARINSQADEI